ncbi:MAG TPA: DMT family transporter [Chloroflexia bacterium]|nr:DMT family transporter [Chloroflexia bacterium]
MSKSPVVPFIVVFVGVLIASTAALMIKAAQDTGMPSLIISAGRLGFAALLLSPIALMRTGREIRTAHRRDLVLGAVAGVFLAVHFASWISSLSYTSVASSTALVTTNPIFVGLASYFLFREKPARILVAGIALTAAGSLLIALSDSSGGIGTNPLLGDALALLGAVAVTGYFLAGQSARKRLSLLAYIWVAYTTAAVILVAWALIAGYSLFGYDLAAYMLLLGLAIGPQLLGHTSFNWALRYLSATVIAVAILGEPVSSTALAFVLRGERPQLLQIAGGVILLAGIVLAVLAERGRAQAVRRAEVEVEVAGAQ